MSANIARVRRFAVFFGGAQIVTAIRASGSIERLAIPKVIVGWRIDVEHHPADRAGVAVHCYKISHTRARRENNPASFVVRADVVVVCNQCQMSHIRAAVNGKQRIKVAPFGGDADRRRSRGRPPIPKRMTAGISRMVWLPRLLGGAASVRRDAGAIGGNALRAAEVVVIRSSGTIGSDSDVHARDVVLLV